MSRCTSSAEPSRSDLDEVRVLRRHRCGADAVALQAGGVDEATGGVVGRVGEHRAGVGSARLVGPPPPDDVGQLGLAGGSIADREGADRRAARPGRRATAERRYPRSRASADISRSSPPDRSSTRTLTRDAAMSDPWPPAFMRTAPPIDPGTPTAHSKPVRPAATDWRATTGRRGRAPGPHDGAVDLDGGERLAEDHGDAGEPTIGHQQVRALPHDEHRHGLGGDRGREPRQVVLGLDAHEHRGRAARPVGGERTEGHVAGRERSERGRESIERGRPRPRHRIGHEPAIRSMTESGTVVRSPAPRVRQRSPGRSSWARKVDHVVARRGGTRGAGAGRARAPRRRRAWR